jgi:predicted glycosyltransferase
LNFCTIFCDNSFKIPELSLLQLFQEHFFQNLLREFFQKQLQELFIQKLLQKLFSKATSRAFYSKALQELYIQKLLQKLLHKVKPSITFQTFLTLVTSLTNSPNLTFQNPSKPFMKHFLTANLANLAKHDEIICRGGFIKNSTAEKFA